MFPLIIGAFIAVSIVCVAAILKGPNKENETVQAIRLQVEREAENETVQKVRLQAEREAEERCARAKQERLLEQQRREIQEKEAEVKRLEAEMAQARLDAEGRRASEEVKARENTRKAEEEEEMRKREEEETRAKIAEERRELDEGRRMLEKLEKEQQEAIEKQKEELAAQLEAEKKFGGPIRWPTREEFQSALARTQYTSSNFNFAIVGRAGSGKSSLINAFRNLRNIDDGAAPTGTTETTLEIKRYNDPGTEAPRKWMVWFDVPGAGTPRIPHRDYFIRQGLYVFDLIVLALGDRFEEIDVRIIADCARFKVPLFIVRSKADMHIINAMKEHGDYARIKENPELYAKCRDKFLKDTQQTVSEGLKREGLEDQAVYIVSRDMLQRTYNSALQGRRWPEFLERDPGMIHERHLVKELLDAATKRRCETSETWLMTEMRDASDAFGFVREAMAGLLLKREDGHGGTHTSPSDAAGSLDGQGQSGGEQAQAMPQATSHRPPTTAPEDHTSCGTAHTA